MSGQRTALITGGTGSLGFHTARAILAADDGWDVVITGRSADAVAETTARLGDRAVGYPLELGSLADVRGLAGELPALDAVICNAGVHTTAGMTYTGDGIEQTFAVNPSRALPAGARGPAQPGRAEPRGVHLQWYARPGPLVPGNDLHTPRQSAAGLARLILDAGLAGTTGKYFAGTREARSSAESYDTEKAADLWETSVALTRECPGC